MIARFLCEQDKVLIRALADHPRLPGALQQHLPHRQPLLERTHPDVSSFQLHEDLPIPALSSKPFIKLQLLFFPMSSCPNPGALWLSAHVASSIIF
jgi:hypothetical protein